MRMENDMEDDMEYDMEYDDMAEQGRGTDSVMAHLSLGEIVIPRAFLDDPQVMQALQMIFADNGTDINEFTVGHEANKINPETGHPEFFRKFLRKIAPFIGPALAIAAPGIGTAIGGSLLGAGAAGSATLGNALLGAGIGAATGGGLKGAALGGLTGGIGANLGSLGSGLQGPTLSGATLDTGGSGILGAVRNATGLTSSSIPSLGGVLGGSTGGGSTFGGLNSLASLAGGFQQDAALKKQRDQLLAAQNQQLGNLENLNPVDVQNDPGFQFNREQGEEALNRSLGARGGLFSGAALKAASDFNQNLANNYYQQAFQRQANKVGAQNQIFGNTGNVQANATLGRSNNINQTLANTLGANVGNFGGNTGGITNEQLLELMRQRVLA